MSIAHTTAGAGTVALARSTATFVSAALAAPLLCVAAAGESVAAPSDRLTPLAYVRTLVVAPPTLATRPDLPLPPTPSGKESRTKWERRTRDRAQFVRLRGQAATLFGDAFAVYVRQIRGLTVLASTAVAEPGPALTDRQPGGARGLQSIGGTDGRWKAIRHNPDASALMDAARRANADAALAVTLDRFGTTAGAQRQVWVRAVAYLAKPAGPGADLEGPYYALGMAGTFRLPFLKSLQKADSDLVQAACDQAARELAHTLVSGAEPLFVRDMRAAIIPAQVPAGVQKRVEGSDGLTLPLPALARQADVLFQPELTPVVQLADPDVVEREMRFSRLRPVDLWSTAGTPNVPAALLLSNRLHANLVFVSRIVDVDLSERTFPVLDNGRPAPGVERRAVVEAEGALVRTDDAKVLWRDRSTGSTISRTEYVRHKARLRTDEQCVVDAAREAYGYLRFSLDDVRRQMIR